ncbi:hypothetical protein GCM10023219_08480 [Stakelama sediminis]|uniref:Putative membrane protein n=1 Tax=Stakelama sediminis TaxID=463200 RepID=A0A840YV59_9SPHN|nr:DUF4142 domain-containing protein [Stakelama sediminis]MBB5717571.1 putative membrane protein [Stakelama sediminis]
MKYSVLSLTMALGGALMLSACGSSTPVGNTADAYNDSVASDNLMVSNMIVDDSGNMAMTAPDNASMPMDVSTMSAQQFANLVAASDAFEIQSAKLAESKATDAKLKDFAKLMIHDHDQSTAELKQAAKTIPGVTPDATLSAQQQADLSALKSASGRAFDTLYAQQQTLAHQQAIGLLQSYAASGGNATLKEWAGKVLPIVKGHLTKIRSIGGV